MKACHTQVLANGLKISSTTIYQAATLFTGGDQDKASTHLQPHVFHIFASIPPGERSILTVKKKMSNIVHMKVCMTDFTQLLFHLQGKITHSYTLVSRHVARIFPSGRQPSRDGPTKVLSW